MEDKTFLVPDTLDGARLDKATVELVTGISRARVKRAIEAGDVRVNGKRRPKGALVAQGDVISLAGEASAEDVGAIASKDLPLDVRFASPSVLVVHKPAGMPTAPIRAGETGTLANALLGHHPELAGVGYSAREPGLLHRLDNDTSGLVVVARTQAAFETLRAALKDGRLAKEYLLVCASDGLPDEGSIEFPIANHPKDQRRVYPCIHPRDVVRYEPRAASTRYRVLRRGPTWALVEAHVSKALRHQIRAHFAAIDHPLVRDALYGGPDVPNLTRHALHASHVSFRGDGDADLTFDVRAPLPEELQALVDAEAPARH